MPKVGKKLVIQACFLYNKLVVVKGSCQSMELRPKRAAPQPPKLSPPQRRIDLSEFRKKERLAKIRIEPNRDNSAGGPLMMK